MKRRELEICSILYVLSAYPKITKYELRKRLAKQGISLAISSFYGIVNQMKEAGFMDCDSQYLLSITAAGLHEYMRLRNLVKIVSGLYS